MTRLPAYLWWSLVALFWGLTMRPGVRYWGYRWDSCRSAIKQRDDHTCTQCKRRSEWNVVRLQCHHRRWVADGGSYFPWNLTMLCKSCHDIAHS